MMKIRDLKITNTGITTLKSNKVRQIISFLEEHYEIRINRFKQSQKEIVSKTKKYAFPPSLDDISLHLQENEIAVSDSILRKIINSPNQISTYDPITEYFYSIGDAYQGVSHIDKFCAMIKAVNYGDRVGQNYYQNRLTQVFRKWMVASVACSLRIQQNEVALGLIQEEEGTGKTTICNWLCPEPLKMMFTRSDREKNGFNIRHAFTENFIVLFDEFLGLNHFTAETFKSTMSAVDIDVKERHDPFPVRKPRIANAMFTTNNKTGRNKGFLFPGLGTRRFACIHIESIEYDRIMEDIDVNQMWSEAYTLFRGGFNYKWQPKDFQEFAEMNERFMIETNAVQIIEANFCKPSNGHAGMWMTPTELMVLFKEKRLAGRDSLAELSPEKIGIALRQLGYEKKGKRIDGLTKYPYYVHPLFPV
jgi:predicted P-loop ATPase